MPLSANAQRTLEQVKTGLCILYGADYFTEDEWIKLDGIIHKGNYVFTNGPPNSFIDEELMTFDDIEIPSAPQQPQELILDTENLSPAISEDPSDTFSLSKFNNTSAVTTPDTAVEEGEKDDGTARKPMAPLPANGGLALGYTQAQLDEVKAFNSGLTKAGQKGRPKYQQVIEESYASPAWSEHGDDGLPTAAEQATRIDTWADEVIAEEPSPVPSPFIDYSTTATPRPPEPSKLVESFVQAHGRLPAVPNDVFQPNNPEFRGPRPESRSSSKNTKSSKVQRKLHATPGTTFLAYSGIDKRSTIAIEVKPGDQIKYIKHVSGVMHHGQNMRTKQQGQFPESVLEPPTSQETMSSEQRYFVQNPYGMARGRAMTASTISHDLDKVENMNAAEWDRESDVSRTTTAGVAPPPPRTFGLAGSRFATAVSNESKPGQHSSFTQAEIRKIIREELAQSPKTQAQVHHSQTVAPHEGALTKVIPKTNTCWFWKTKNDCRFTAEECRDLHADIPTGEPTNLRSGKPTWGALADALPPQPLPSADPEQPPNPQIEFKHFTKSKTCYYWATDGKCHNTAEDCKYLHEYTPAGVAPRPGGYARKKDFNWTKKTGPPEFETAQSSQQNNSDTQTQVGGDFTTQESWTTGGDPETLIDSSWDEPNPTDDLENPNAAIWGAVEGASAWDVSGDKYKPPHIKALEERQRIEAVGW